MTRVLIADDHPLLLSGVARLLDETDYEVVAKIADGARVADALAETQPAIAILDINMPGATGLAVVAAARAQDREEGSGPRFVLLTAELSDDELLTAMELKVDGILLKNGGERLLVDCLDRVSAGGRFIPQELLNRATTLERERARDPIRNLSPREKELASLVAQGMRNRTIAEELGLSEGTVKVYLNRIYEKLEIASRTELALAVAKRSSGDS